ncbi:MAG: hypothetical protein KA248_07290 [Kiritimatiellae bacterium]|nr:hypothetical protein [Kiritimatiellia bacterium]
MMATECGAMVVYGGGTQGAKPEALQSTLLLKYGTPPDSAADPESWEIEMVCILENTDSGPLPGVDFPVDAPVAESATHGRVELNPYPEAEIRRDSRGNQKVMFSLSGIPPCGKKIVSVKARWTAPAKAQPLSDMDRDRYPAEDPGMGARHSIVAETVRRLKGSPPQGTARALYAYMIGVVENKTDGRPDTGWGSAGLMTALCRAAGIPARVMGGYLKGSCSRHEMVRRHHWAEFHDGFRWRVADCTQQRFAVEDNHYLATRACGGVPGREEES